MRRASGKKGKAVNGWLVLDKPAGVTSTYAVGAMRRAFGARKAGHAGTLDPAATGVLPIAFGEATKTVPYAVDGEKCYRFTVRWGAQTETDDAEGRVLATSTQRSDAAAISRLLAQFTGEILQTPPAYSAIKVAGRRAYDLARGGEAVSLEPRPVLIHSLRLIDTPDADSAVFEARCGKGTYVRALARDMGRVLGCLGHLIALRRTRVAGFEEAAAISLNSVELALEHGEAALLRLLLPIEAALNDFAVLNVGQAEAARLLNGQPILLRGRDAPYQPGPTYALCRGHLVALGEIARGELHPIRVFHLGDAG
ncbi:MAG TPA: tRNA pseudouridine(55) synthase TruB [Hyphomicrobiaceae bacterium]|jgi:tRNA pseudouridine55 synthase|nr:tRNA pseudouridine(55) synthase TruB [Hyphomicrobiaceae bacterium]